MHKTPDVFVIVSFICPHISENVRAERDFISLDQAVLVAIDLFDNYKHYSDIRVEYFDINNKVYKLINWKAMRTEMMMDKLYYLREGLSKRAMVIHLREKNRSK